MVVGLVIAVVAIVTAVVGVVKRRAGAGRAGWGSQSWPSAGAGAGVADLGGLTGSHPYAAIPHRQAAGRVRGTAAAVELQRPARHQVPPSTVTTANNGVRVPEFRFTIKQRRLGGMVRPGSDMLLPALMGQLLRLSNRGRDTGGVSAAWS